MTRKLELVTNLLPRLEMASNHRITDTEAHSKCFKFFVCSLMSLFIAEIYFHTSLQKEF